LTFMNWMSANGMDINSRTNEFPNVNGASRESLDMLVEFLNGNVDWMNDYGYIAGLREDDPGDLVLLYFNRPTRWIWHGVPGSVFAKKEWIIVPVDFTLAGRPEARAGELNERVSAKELKRRIKQTLEFIRANERPHWQAIVAEHTKFVESIDSQ